MCVCVVTGQQGRYDFQKTIKNITKIEILMMKTYGTYDISWKMPNKFNKIMRRRGEDYKKKR